MLSGALFQLVTPWAVRRLRSYRRWIVLCAVLQALSFTPLVIGAALGHITLGWLAISVISYWAFGMSTGPAWNAWVTSLVPQRIRAHFFAHRTRAAQAALFGRVESTTSDDWLDEDLKKVAVRIEARLWAPQDSGFTTFIVAEGNAADFSARRAQEKATQEAVRILAEKVAAARP